MRPLVALVVSVLLSLTGRAAPQPENLLSPETAFMITVPDLPVARGQWTQSSFAALWNTPAMRPFRDRFIEGWKTEFLQPFERELDLNVGELAGLIRGSATFALSRQRMEGPVPQTGFLILADAKDKSPDLKRYLDQVRERWSLNPARSFRTQEVRGIPCSVVTLSSNDLSRTFKRFFPGPLDYQEIGQEPPKAPASKREVLFAQVNSMLVLASSFPLMEGTLDRMAGGATPALAEQSGFQVHQARVFKDAALFGWVDGKALFQLLSGAGPATDNPLAPNPFEVFQPAQLLAGSGLASLQTIGFSTRANAEGTTFDLNLAVPDSTRAGVFRVLSGEPKSVSSPGFVPADAVKFQRWRIDGQKTWSAFEKLLAEASPQTLNSLNFIIDTANLAATQKSPGFDLRKVLLGNLGDDFMLYAKAGREGQGGDPSEGPGLWLIASPDPELFAASMQHVLLLVTAHAGSPQEREFLGRKILSVPMPELSLSGAPGGSSPPRTLHYVGGSGYVAFSTELSVLEEYLRSSEQAKSLRDTPGIVAASEKVLVPSSSYFRYSDTRRSLRPSWESLRKGADPASVGPLNTVNNLPGMKTPEKRVTEWLDFSLLPPFSAVASHLGFTVAANQVTAEGIAYRLFAPTPLGPPATAP